MGSKSYKRVIVRKPAASGEEPLTGHHHNTSESTTQILSRITASQDNPKALGTSSVMQLQRTVGNRATQTLVQRRKKKRLGPLSYKDTVRSMLMTKAEWQKLTKSIFNQRGAKNSEILEIDHILEQTDEKLEARNPDPMDLLRNDLTRLRNSIRDWKAGFNSEEEMQSSGRYAAFMKLEDQLRQIVPLVQRWLLEISGGGNPDKINYLKNIGNTIKDKTQNYKAKLD